MFLVTVTTFGCSSHPFLSALKRREEVTTQQKNITVKTLSLCCCGWKKGRNRAVELEVTCCELS